MVPGVPIHPSVPPRFLLQPPRQSGGWGPSAGAPLPAAHPAVRGVQGSLSISGSPGIWGEPPGPPRISLNTLTLPVRSEKVHTRHGVPSSVTGIAQLRCPSSLWGDPALSHRGPARPRCPESSRAAAAGTEQGQQEEEAGQRRRKRRHGGKKEEPEQAEEAPGAGSALCIRSRSGREHRPPRIPQVPGEGELGPNMPGGVFGGGRDLWSSQGIDLGLAV
ncbi:uncharacterized protein LOC116438933 [Corvus moneduloides]|uniref:uncharacterized protein LOC116438933 n=1 Tax=Corvus moneduloides TaxID=1196302 RepID=UPI001362E42B|nr:uncharacterized protein LOC116438933 [Corvus moneduloides]